MAAVTTKTTIVADAVVRVPECDERKFRLVTLPNGLRAIVVSDPKIKMERVSKTNDAVTSESKSGCLMSKDDSNGEDTESDDEDCSSKKASAALAVGVGSFSDPQNLGGLAHFTEHMLFMGTQKYPKENEFENFLSKAGGSSNAFTDHECTVYAFDVHATHIEGALDRFAQFFIEPLMKEDATNREIQAVDSEFTMSLSRDGARRSQLLCHMSKSGHPLRNFSWGNRKSLCGSASPSEIKRLRSALLAFQKRHYRANKMTLCVVGGQNLDALETLVRSTFSSIPSSTTNDRVVASTENPLSTDAMATLTILPSIRTHTYRLNLYWYLRPPYRFARRSADYVGDLIGHEGEGSVLAALKRRSWATAITVGVDEESGTGWNSAASLFDIDITCTREGADHVEDIVEIIMSYVAMLRRAGPQKWFWDECKCVNEAAFRFSDPSDSYSTAESIAFNMWRYGVRDALSGPYAWRVFDAEEIEETLSQLDPRHVAVFLTSSAHGDENDDDDGCDTKTSGETASPPPRVVAGHKMTKTEPWFRCPYASIPFSSSSIARWTSIFSLRVESLKSELALPRRNPFIVTAQDLRVKFVPRFDEVDRATKDDERKSLLSSSSRPRLVLENGRDGADRRLYRVWHKQDKSFMKPKAYVWYQLCCEEAVRTPMRKVLTQLVIELCTDKMTATIYEADLAQLWCSFRLAATGICIHVYGFDCRIRELSMRIARAFASLPSWTHFEDRLKAAKEKLVRRYENSLNEPTKQSRFMRLRALTKRMWTPAEYLECVRAVRAQEVKKHCALLFGKSARAETFMEALLVGNITRAEGCEMSEAFAATLGIVGVTSPIDSEGDGLVTPVRCVGAACLKIADGASVRAEASCVNSAEASSATEVYFQLGLASNTRERCYVDLLDYMIDEPFYDHMRTKQQLGYVVECGSRETEQCIGFCFVVKGSAVSPPSVEARIMAFVRHFREMLRDMTSEEFVSYRRAAVQGKLEPDNNLDDEASRYFGEISQGRYAFSHWEAEAKMLAEISQSSMLIWFTHHFCSPKRRRCVVHVHSKHAVTGYCGASEFESETPLAASSSANALDCIFDAMGSREKGSVLSVSKLHGRFGFHPEAARLAMDARRELSEMGDGGGKERLAGG
eukprot:g1513.t1